MKKAILLLALAASTSLSFAQVEKVKEAKKKASSETPDFEGAKAAIEAALQDESTKNACETWYTKGLVYFKMFEFEDNKRFEVPAGTPDVNVQSEASYNALKAWMISDSLDVVESTTDPKRKGKLKFRKDVAEKLASMKNYISNYGTILYQKDDFAGAIKSYKDFTALPNLDIFKGTDLMPAADSAFIDAKANIEVSYRKLYSKQVAMNDIAGSLKTLEYGVANYPNNSFFLVNKIDYDIKNNNAEGALSNIEKAIQLNPTNFMFYYVRGYIYSTKKDKVMEAKADFEKAVSLKPDFADAQIGLGSLYYEIAQKSYERASFDIKDPKAADVEMKKAEELYKQALPYFEKARELKSTEPAMLQKMQGIYRKLKMSDKEKEIKALRGL